MDIEVQEGEGFSSSGEEDNLRVKSTNQNARPSDQEKGVEVSSKSRGRKDLDIERIKQLLLDDDDFFSEMSNRRVKNKSSHDSMTSTTDGGKGLIIDQVKSPSETTVYVQALKRKGESQSKDHPLNRYHYEGATTTSLLNSEFGSSSEFNSDRNSEVFFRWRD